MNQDVQILQLKMIFRGGNSQSWFGCESLNKTVLKLDFVMYVCDNK